MKTYSVSLRALALVLAILLFGGDILYSQSGTVTILGNPNTRITDCETGQPVGAGYIAALHWGPAPATDRNQFVQLGASSPVVNGMLLGGTRTIAGAVSGSSVNLFAAAWESARGSTYQQASQVFGARVGVSDIVTVPLGGSVRIPDFQVCPVPEPSTFALAALALGAVLMRTRRVKR